MFNNKFVSIKKVADKIKRGKLYKDIPFESIIDYGVDALRLIMSEKYFVARPARLKVENHKAKLPCGFELMIQATRYDCKAKTFIPMRYGTDNFHSIYHLDTSPDISCKKAEHTYVINNSVITTDFKDGEIVMVYKSINVDDDGLPLVPDNVNVLLALEYYIKYKYLDDIGAPDEQAIERRKNDDEQMYCWYVGKAQAAATNMTMDEWESLGNSMSQMFVNHSQFRNRLKNLGMQEYLKLE